MQWVRKGALVSVAVLAVMFLLAAALDSGVVRIFGSPEPIKKSLADSGIYDSLIPSLLEQAGSDASPNRENIPFNSKIVSTAAESTFDSGFLRSSSDRIIDSLYRWLQGQTPQPDFKINLSGKKTEFVNKVANSVKVRVAGLPLCTKNLSSGFDAFSSKCRPAAISPSQAAAAVRKDLLSNQDFMSDTLIDASEVKSESGEPLFSETYKNVPDYYQGFKTSPLVLAILAALALAGVVLLSRSALFGLKHAGFILIGVGIFVLLFGLAVDQAIDNKVLSQIKLDNSVLEHGTRQLAADLTQRITNTYLTIGGIYSALGMAAASAYYIISRRRV